MNRDKPPLRYTPWLALDLVKVQLTLFGLVAVALPLVVLRIEKSIGGPPNAVVFLQRSVMAGLTIFTLMAIGGAIGGDLQGGFYRAWFSKPMAPWWYYLQRFVLAGLAVLLAPLMLGGMFSLIVRNGNGITVDLMITVALGYLLVGSACLLFSNFLAKDWLLVFFLSFFQQRLATVIEMGAKFGAEVPQWLVMVKKVLPPFHLINPLEPALQGRELAHVLIYSAAMLVVALLIVQTRPLGSGGRA